MIRSPNPEQESAIKHQGGCLLKAGAGSGKTFVLVEHIIHLVSELIENHQDFEKELLEKFSKSVLMTFTNLAAGEIKVRLYNRFEQQLQYETKNKDMWELSYSHLDKLLVTTIDGFCFKLIKRGYFTSISPEIELVMEDRVNRTIENLWHAWVLQNDSEFQLKYENWEEFLSDEKSILSSLSTIFLDPELRTRWENFKIDENKTFQLDYYFSEIVDTYGWNFFLNSNIPNLPIKKAPDKLSIYFEQLHSRFKPLKSWKDILDWGNFFNNDTLSFPKSPTKKDDNFDVIAFIQELKGFKKEILEMSELYLEFTQSYETRIYPFLYLIKNLIDHISLHYPFSVGLSYSDIEYYVLKGLQNEKVAALVRSDFNYFIVDEFQDTSLIQFDIIQILMNGDFTKLFCIGDAKQAIYGFRGGEVALFQKCETQVPMKRELVNNYRSNKKVIDFNNGLFNYILPLKEGWSGSDPHTVKMSDQLYPQADIENSSTPIKMIQVQIDQEKKKIKTADLNRFEAKAIVQYLKENTNHKSTAILYKYLKPSYDLINELIKNDIGFSAQLKVPFGQDPVFGIFFHLLEYSLDQKNKQINFVQMMVKGYLSLAGFDLSKNIEYKIQRFIEHESLLGLEYSFKEFLYESSVGFYDIETSLNKISELIILAAGDRNKLYKNLKSLSLDNYQMDFSFKDSALITIMTVHASKGLEFDRVILGGISVNQYQGVSSDRLGSIPGAISWRKNKQGKEKTRSPLLQWEINLKKKKNFSESKRLFYVACTRAKEELVFVQMNTTLGEEMAKNNSWGQGLNCFLTDKNPTVQKIDFQHEIIKSEKNIPFFHGKNLGYFNRLQDSEIKWGISSELSVTKLGLLLDCPFKFYLLQVLKYKIKNDDPEIQTENFIQDTGELMIKSNSERGSRIHLALSQAINHNFVIPREHFQNQDHEVLSWTLGKLKENLKPESKLISETEIKFELFGFMMVGIPDLIIQNSKNSILEIWDFKTGKENPKTALKYWIQLQAYAYALYLQGDISEDQKIRLILCYSDQKILRQQELSQKEITSSVYEVWKELSNLEKKNQDHCSSCQIKTLCPHASF